MLSHFQADQDCRITTSCCTVLLFTTAYHHSTHHSLTFLLTTRLVNLITVPQHHNSTTIYRQHHIKLPLQHHNIITTPHFTAVHIPTRQLHNIATSVTPPRPPLLTPPLCRQTPPRCSQTPPPKLVAPPPPAYPDNPTSCVKVLLARLPCLTRAPPCPPPLVCRLGLLLTALVRKYLQLTCPCQVRLKELVMKSDMLLVNISFISRYFAASNNKFNFATV